MSKNETVPTRFKLSPFGLIPTDWQIFKIQKLIEEDYLIDHLDGNHGALYPSAEEFSENGIPYISANNFSDGIVDFNSCKRLSEERAQRFKKGIAINNDVLFAHNATVGPVALLKTNLEYVILGTTATYFRCNKDKLINTYLLYALQSSFFVKQYSKIMFQSTRNQVPITTQRKLSLTIPKLQEQIAIAHILGLMDTAINKNNQLISEKELQKKWLMQNLLTGKKRLKGFGSEWKEYKISQLGQIVTGNTPSMTRPEYYGDKYCWATAFDFKGVYIDETDIKLSDEGKNVARIVPRGSILVTCIASIGKNAIANVGMAFNQQINAIVPNENFNSEFIYYIIENSLHKLKEVAGAGAVSIINKSNFETLKLKFPLIEEQTAIAQVFHAVDKEIQLLKTKTKKLREQKKGLMQVLLTGKKRIVLNNEDLKTNIK